jgi:LuxR family maltose regulon positive regulatory protein
MQWAEADPLRRFGWVTLEETENDAVLMWRYVLLALQTLAPGVADKAHRLIEHPKPDIQAVASAAINGLLEIPGRLVVVLDDYHIITNRVCHESIQFFIDHLPMSTQVAFGTRDRPPLSLTKLAANGMVLDIDATDLRFTFEETQGVLGRASGPVTVEQAAKIQRDTEGWPVGVLLSAKAMESGRAHTSVSRGQRAIRAYLMEEMLDQMPEDDRLALADWSILRRFNGNLADRVSGRGDSATVLEQLTEGNLLLIALDEQGDWYRFHDLLRDVLRHEFGQRSQDHQIAAHSRATEWFLENGDEPEAVRHALEASQFARAGELICVNWFPYMLTGHLEMLRGWIDKFPADALRAYPPLLVSAGWIYAFSGDGEKTRRFAAAASEATFDGNMLDGTASYESAVALLRASLGHLGMRDANEWAELAYQLEPAESPWRPSAAALAGVTRYGMGRYDEAKTALSEAAQSPTGPDGVATYAQGQLALLLMSEGDWEEASRQADQACEVIEQMHIGNLLSSGAAQVAAAAAAAHGGKTGLTAQRLNSFARVQGVMSDAIPFDAFQLHLVAGETELAIGNQNAATVHARSASAHLDSFGDGGIFEGRLEALLEGLEGSDEVVLDFLSDEPEVILTDRELQVLTLLTTDLSLREIGDQLYVSRNTAKTHVAHVYKKLGVPDRNAAIARARQLDLI